MSYMDTYTKWCTNSYFDEDTKKELRSLEGNDEEIKDRFYRQLEFGTGGLRGVIGAGTNRMNIYLHRASGNTGACQLHYLTERTGQRRCDRIRFKNYVQRVFG